MSLSQEQDRQPANIIPLATAVAGNTGIKMFYVMTCVQFLCKAVREQTQVVFEAYEQAC